MKLKGIPNVEQLNRWTEAEVSFEYNDFMFPHILDDSQEVERRVRAYLDVTRDRGDDTLHGPFLDIAVHSSDTLIQKISDMRIRQACDIAVKLHAKAVILHTNLIPNFYEPQYRQSWLERNEVYLRSLLRDYPSLHVYMENMFDEEPDSLVALAERMKGERFGICLDLAHAHISKTLIEKWHEACAPYIMQYHINDNDGVVDSHLPVGEGTMDWTKVWPILNRELPILIEVDSLEKMKKSMAYLHRIQNM